MGLLEKIFGNYSEKEIKKIKPIVAKIEALGPQFESYTDEELKILLKKPNLKKCTFCLIAL